jgi:hypothetical protein
MMTFASRDAFVEAVRRGDIDRVRHMYRLQHAESCLPSVCTCKPQYLVSADPFERADGFVWRQLNGRHDL